RPRQGGEGRRRPVAESLSRLHRADVGRHALERRSGLQHAIPADGRRPEQGRRAGGGEEGGLSPTTEKGAGPGHSEISPRHLRKTEILAMIVPADKLENPKRGGRR